MAPGVLERARANAGGCWSQARPGVFFTARQDGALDVWDLHFKHQAPTLQVQARPLLLLSRESVRFSAHLELAWLSNVTQLFLLSFQLLSLSTTQRPSIIHPARACGLCRT